jgi:hypothetical protein
MKYESKVIIAAVQENFGLDISLRTRRREIVDARQAVFVAMRVMGSTTQIAECFDMDHSTIIYASRQHEHKYNVNADLRLKHFDLYCAVYDFVNNLIKEKKFDQYNAIMNVREELERHKIIVDDLREMLNALEKDNKSLEKKVKDLAKFKIAFTQLRTKLNETA